MENFKEMLARNAIFFREKNGLTQEALAEKAGLSSKMIQKIEYQQSWPSAETLQKLVKVLKCELWELFFPLNQIRPSELEASFRELYNKLALTLEPKQIQVVIDFLMAGILNTMPFDFRKREEEDIEKIKAQIRIKSSAK